MVASWSKVDLESKHSGQPSEQGLEQLGYRRNLQGILFANSKRMLKLLGEFAVGLSLVETNS